LPWPTTLAEWGALALSYLLGSVPFGLLFGLVFKGVDIRRAGSHSIGATNTSRVLGRPFGLAAFFCDCAKGWLPVAWIAPGLASAPERAGALALLCGALAVLGHVYPVWLRFQGGKAVATGCGAMIGLDPVVFLAGGAVWLVALAVTRYVGLSSILMTLGFVVSAALRTASGASGREALLGAAGLFLLVLWRHRANIARMLAGTEPRIGRRSRAGS
jgi:glycerol-3-phosphate acyltransferase PlsY